MAWSGEVATRNHWDRVHGVESDHEIVRGCRNFGHYRVSFEFHDDGSLSIAGYFTPEFISVQLGSVRLSPVESSPVVKESI
jgi:hypothetical protein